METIAKYNLATKQQLNVVSRATMGSGGEPIQEVKLEVAGLTVCSLETLKPVMKPEDYNDIEEYIEQIEEANYLSLITFSN